MKNRSKNKRITYISLGAVLLAVCSWISILGFTMQTFGVFFLIYFLGAKAATASITVYLLLGAFGLPVFYGFSGGILWLFGPTGGYLFGFLAAGGVCIAAEAILKDKAHHRIVRLLLSLVALFVCYALGASYFALIYKGGTADILEVFKATFLGFIVFDALKILLADFLANYMQRIKRGQA